MIVRQMLIGWLIYLALAVQPGVTSVTSVAGGQLWLPGIALVACMTLTRGSASLVWAAILGLGVDCLSADRLGVHLVVATLVACGLSIFWSENRSRNLIALTASVLSATFLWKFASAICHATLSHVACDPSRVAITSLGDAVFTALIAGALLSVGSSLMRSIRSERHGSVSLSNRWSMLSES